MGGWNTSPRGRAIDYCTYSKYPNKDYSTRQECMDKARGREIIDRTVEDKRSMYVVDKRSIVYKVWSKHKTTIMILGALGVGYFVYKKFIKK